MSLSYVETTDTSDAAAIRARLRIEWRHRAAVFLYRTFDRLTAAVSRPGAEDYLLPLIGLSFGVIAGIWLI